VTTDCIIIKSIDGFDKLLLIKRKHEPFVGKWAFPGGFVEINEDLLEGAKRELQEETGIAGVELRQFKTYGKPGRDPRGRTISVVFHGKMMDFTTKIAAGDDAAEAAWFQLNDLPLLAFDHELIIKEFIKSLL